ncbi:hypothetical protein BH18ACI3_BH18ACI3_15180 [soil metagenome]
MAIDIRKVSPILPRRPCRYCLSLQDDSVFADFDVDGEGCVLLVRISFDGFGCCYTAEKIRSMSSEISRTWIDLVEADDTRAEVMSTILSQYFLANSDVIWKDALEEHHLVPE